MAATAQDYEDDPNAVKTLMVQGQPPTNDSVHLQEEAGRDVRIIGWTTGDTGTLSKSYHQWIKCWIGGDLPGGEQSGNGIAAYDDERFLFEYDCTQVNDAVNSLSLGYDDSVTTMFPEGKYVEWNEGETLNVKFWNTTGGDNSGNDYMEVVLYYVPAEDHGGLA